ncbi:hypothetical protein HYU07_02300 [Candidatus Woesearchaeota archaeon]|nr:hypothetical protein [Candidatus Woesearchaeota archaeon]
MNNILCIKCKVGKMVRKGVMDSGNSRYTNYECDHCGNLITMCEGLNPEK